MKKSKNLNVFNKILILLLIILSFNFVCPTMSSANELGGKLLEPVTNLLTSLGDGVLNIVHKFVMGQEYAIIHSSSNLWQIILGVLIGLGVAIALIVVPTSIGITALSIGAVLLVSSGSGILAYNNLSSSIVSLPVYSISPEEIFMNKIPLLNIDFFNPEAQEDTYTEQATKITDISSTPIGEILAERGFLNNLGDKYYYRYYDPGEKKDGYILNVEEWKYDNTIYHLEYEVLYGAMTANYRNITLTTNGQKESLTSFDLYKIYGFLGGELGEIFGIGWDSYHETKKNYEIDLTSDNIEDYKQYSTKLSGYSGGILTLEWEDISGNNYTLTVENGNKKLSTVTSYTNSAAVLQPIVSKWYVTLRNIALVMSMSILVYIGIRMMLTSIASQKAKYKSMFFDWLIGICLIFVMHYIMVFAVTLNNVFIELVTNVDNFTAEYTAALKVIDEGKTNKAIEDVLNKYGNEVYGMPLRGDDSYVSSNINSEGYVGYKTNLMGAVRLLIQEKNNESLSHAGYVVMFLVLIFYTIAFLFTYIKRVIYMAVLTILAPFVAMTYPLDKANDGQAQAFNMWLKEYIFNLLIQPMHLLLYYILISSAINLATKNILYSIVALGFLLPAEKIIRRFFGFDKAKTPGFLNGAAGAAVVMSAVGGLKRFGSSGSSNRGNSEEQNRDGKIRTKDNGAKISIEDTSFNQYIQKAEKEEQALQKSIQEQEKNIIQEQIKQKRNILVTQKEQLQSRLAELTAEGFEAGDTEYDKIAKELGTSKINSELLTNAKQQNIIEDIQDEQESTEDTIDRNDEPRKRSILGAIGGVAGGLAKGGLKLTGKLPNLAARGFGAAILGAVGLAAGIATGDANNAFKYTLAGGTAGSALGSGLLNRATNAAENIADDAIRGYYSDDYDKYLNSQSDIEFFTSKENRDEYKSEFGSNFKEKMKDALEYRKLGITDNTVIIRAMKLPSKFGGKDMTSKEKLYIAQLAAQISSRSDLARLRESFVRKGVAPGKIDTIEEGIRIIKKWD